MPQGSPQSNGSARPTITTTTPISKPVWPSAEDEKRRLFEQAQARVRQTQGLGPLSPDSPTGPSLPESSASNYAPVVTPPAQRTTTVTPSRPALITSTSDSSSGSHGFTPKPAISAGAALYSHAMASINRNNSTLVTSRATPAVVHKRNVSVGASSNSSTITSPSREPPMDESARRYYAARRAVAERQRIEGGQTPPQDEPIPYEQLFGNGAPAGSSQGNAPLSEKEQLRRKYEEDDAAASATPLPATTPPPPQPSNPPNQPLSEKEIMRRAFEARDAALRRAGQTPPPMILPAVTPPRVNRSASVRSNLPQPPVAPGPPVYDAPPPSWSAGSSSRPLTALEEKAQLAAQYAAQEPVPAPPIPTPATPPSRSLGPTPDVELSRERSFRSDTREVFLRRDPSISAGKKRASQMSASAAPTPPPPPPLPPRPPQEYIEETKMEDRRTTLLSNLQLDFSSSFDLGFGTIAESPATETAPSNPTR